MSFANDYILPAVNAINYPAATGNSLLINVNYSIRSGTAERQIPTDALSPGQNMRIRVLAPPGVTSVTIRAESNQWQGGAGSKTADMPHMRSYDTDPGRFVGGSRPVGTTAPDGSIYLDDLSVAGGGLNDLMYGTGNPTYPVTETPRYLYFILHNPSTSVRFVFASLNFSMLIVDTAKYSAWRNERPWAGGSSGSIDGVDATSTVGDTARRSGTTLPELGATSIGVSGSSTKLYGGISVNGGPFLQSVSQNLADPVSAQGFFQVGPEHVGQTADIVVYASYTPPGGGSTLFYMLNEGGAVIAWDRNFAGLTPFISNVVLPAEKTLSMYNGNFVGAGLLQVYFGYRLQADGTVVICSKPINININA